MAKAKGNGAVAETDTTTLDLDDTAPVNDDGEDTVVEAVDHDQIDDLFKDLKTLLSTVEKLQKARQDVGDIKPLIVRLLDGELVSGDDLEELRGGISGLSKLLKLYSDYQGALERAQPARAILDQLLKS
ncbi:MULTISPECIES: hypothetical protein [Cyanophyceae]|uniref:hypothetical protein n=1 Tax=Cyanophyceae TaxID=3028117 RepID=UPI001686A030|nr:MULTISPECIES: hypothetical protein [Cyanophyceae]MBD1917062.1 hypothetical protein [Phormidium sp. FACHB-77]MBD2030593.1 hypothetical protein [Phormidium sp. FACHB-322]MBD2050299.1 hypothetical protein [Leptolyngbya sp. FACHB-60]